MEGERLMIKNETLVLLLAIMACFCCCHLISSRLPKGKWRLISLVPVFYIFTILPLYTTSALSTASTAAFITWLANFKLLLFAFDRGPIACKPYKKSLPIFVAMAALPFKIKHKNSSEKLTTLYFATEILILAIVVSILHEYYKNYYITSYTTLHVYIYFQFLLTDVTVGLSSLIVQAVSGLELEPPCDKPYLSTSPQEFWGRRRNLSFGNILRETVHEPVRSATRAVLGRDRAAMAGVMAAFLVSGLMHELWIWYITRAKPTWEMTMFFVVHGVRVAVQHGMKVAFPEKKWRLPWLVSGPLTVGFVVATSFWLFFPPLIRRGAYPQIIGELRVVAEGAMGHVIYKWI